jgi:hypothetical protein
MDISSVFFMLASLYLVTTEKFKLLLFVFFLGAVNHYSIIFIVPAYLLFRYNKLFRSETIIKTIALTAIFAGYFIIAGMLLPDLPPERDDGFYKWDSYRTLRILTESPRHLLIRDIFMNFGGIHIFALLFVLSGDWKKLKKQYVLVYLVTLIFILLTFTGFCLYSEELRCYVPILPFLLIPAMLFFSRFTDTLLPINNALLEEINYDPETHDLLQTSQGKN